MSSSNTSINLLPLDFASLKASFQVWLNTQPIFKDFNFSGSNLNVLLDLLSINDFKMMFYGNMLGSEMFLDSAQLRDSVVSHAKELNYTPRSNKSAVIDCDIVVNTNDITKTNLLMSQYTSFTGRIGSNNYSFSTNTNITGLSTNNIIIMSNVQLYEGFILTDVFNVNGSNTQRFIISNPNIDTSSLSVIVSESGVTSNLIYQSAPSLFGLNENSQIYFLQGAENNTYEIVFGDGVIGRQPQYNDIISVKYRVSSGPIPNGISFLTSDGLIGGFSNVSIVPLDSAHDGMFAETTNSIKFNAPRHFNTQERAVTAEDYESLLQINFPEIQAISAYGGDEVNPPQYGVVFIAIQLTNINGLPSGKITQYTNWLQSRSALNVIPIFTNPIILYVDVNVLVKYNINVTQFDSSDIITKVYNNIISFNNKFLNNFKSTLYYSQLENTIDNADFSIISNETNLRLISLINPQSGIGQNFLINFFQPLVNNLPPINTTHLANLQTTITSTTFISAGQTVLIEDDNNGNILLVGVSLLVHKIISIIGTVDYSSGSVFLTNLISDTNKPIKIYALSKNKDLISNQNVILQIDTTNIEITTTQVSI
jgi:hypothetical protein